MPVPRGRKTPWRPLLRDEKKRTLPVNEASQEMTTMEEGEHEGEESSCPFLIPRVSGPPVAFSIPVYCRQSNGRVRVPPRDQLMFLCTAKHHHDGPGYGRWRSRTMSN
jgi:hypothetical protein